MFRPLSLRGSRPTSARRTGAVVVALAAVTALLSGYQTGPDRLSDVRLAAKVVKSAAPDGPSVLLPTGQRVRVSGTAPSERVSIQRAAGDGGQPILTLHRAGGTYVVPASALPYLGHGLDRELFNVTRPATGEVADRARLRMTYPTTRPSVAGLTVTATSKGSARGYVTSASAADFGRFVRARFQADQGRSDHPALFAAGVTLSPAAKSPAPPAKSQATAAKVALTVKAIGSADHPLSNVSAWLVDADDAFNEDVPELDFTNGVAKAKLAPGTYIVQALDERAAPGDPDRTIQTRLVVLPDLKVSGQSVTATLDFRKATIQPRPTTPKPAQQLNYGFFFTQMTNSGVWANLNLETDGAGELLLAPIAKAPRYQRAGHVWQLAAPGKPSAAAYTYDLAAMSDQLKASTTYQFAAADLATVKASYQGDGSSRIGSFLRTLFAGSYIARDSGILQPVSAGLRRTEYVGYRGLREDGGARWLETYQASDNVEDPTWFDGLTPSVHRPGTTTTTEWGRGPLTAGIPRQSGEDGGLCFMCRGKSQMNVLLVPFLDRADHVGFLKPPNDDIANTRFQLYLGSKKLDDFDQAGSVGEVEAVGDVVTVGSQKGPFRAVFDVDRRMQDPRLSTRTRTVLTFASAKDKGPRPPLDWACPASSFNCRVLPVLTARVNLATGTDGSIPVGRSTVTVTAGRVQHADPSALKSVQLQVRYPGRDWTTVKLTATATGRYTGTLNSTAFAGRTADLLLKATDKGGSSFEQTVLRAYAVADR